jgi:hypothetical protein
MFAVPNPIPKFLNKQPILTQLGDIIFRDILGILYAPYNLGQIIKRP